MKLLFFILFPLLCFGQGLIVNEISNGAAGNQEYYELVVIGSTSNPLGNVDLRGWIIDDNNGDYNGNISGVGIAQGHIRISSSCLSSVKPGSIILIYNSAELLFTNDETDSNGDCIYIFPINSSCLEHTTTLPLTTNPNYLPSTYTATKLWDRVSLANGGDAGQTRRPNGTFFHGFSYGTVDTTYPSFPSEFGGTSSFNVIAGTGAGRNYMFNSGNFTTQSNFTRGTVPTNETPGQPNNDFNRYFINSLRNGTYNYSNLSDPINSGTSPTLADCATFLPINIIKFEGLKVGNKVKVHWVVENPSDIKQFNLEYSNNGYEFYQIGQFYSDNITTEYNFDDDLRNGESYYRLQIIENNNDITYSNIINISNQVNDDLIIYPNPTKNILNINKNVDKVVIYNELGMMIDYEFINNQIILNDISTGIYVVKLVIGENVIFKKVVIE